MSKTITITYTGGLNYELDVVIKREMKKQGHKWYAQGLNQKSHIRDIVFDRAEQKGK